MGFPDAIRISVGTAQENDAFLQAMRELWPNASRAAAAPAQRTAG
jgi:histidinol-phosphate/aromatic aminotransferase/cobyric acid decarboxylase-like protein